MRPTNGRNRLSRGQKAALITLPIVALAGYAVCGGTPDPGEGNAQWRGTIFAPDENPASSGFFKGYQHFAPVNGWLATKQQFGYGKLATTAMMTEAHQKLQQTDTMMCARGDSSLRAQFTSSAGTDDANKNFCIDIAKSLLKTDGNGIMTVIFPVGVDPEFSGKDKVDPYKVFKKLEANDCANGRESYNRLRRTGRKALMTMTRDNGLGVIPPGYTPQVAIVAASGAVDDESLRLSCDTWTGTKE